ncbi:uncharacterized protein RHOBADRAFT_53812 [Rhodotorula graminis WP1]|uniref:Uncharacterized protein n=1 Tax=Rhodotorula graminis (strain WP1) TaxID=578459 RepID=A0A194S2R6_RHOGW|nr:uncharacterized protein RHOBADRAFT_53812 [Rhodotorula graminis WP1]KPV74882.1 hypothetical protein RHOBADRAFT_53812 [Rhodotorula graminis WP1]
MSRKALHVQPVFVSGTPGVQVFRFQQTQARLPQTASHSIGKAAHAGGVNKRALAAGLITLADMSLVAGGYELGRHIERKKELERLAYPHGLSTRQGAVYARAAQAGGRSRRYLDRLDARTALRHVNNAVRETGLAGRRAGDIARRELEHGWQAVDRKMDDSTLLGSGAGGSPFAFTEWDGLKWAAGNAARSAQREASLVRAQLRHLPQLVSGAPSSSTANLERGVQLHGSFARRYLGYAAKDGYEALRQAEMAGRYAFEVGARRLLASGQPEKRQVFKSRSPADPLTNLADQQERERHVSQGLLASAGVAADVGLGYALEKAVRRREGRSRAAAARGGGPSGL